jgi:hypothetical protein
MGNLQVRFLEGWAPAMAPGYSSLGITSEIARDPPGIGASSETPTVEMSGAIRLTEVALQDLSQNARGR